MPCRCLLLPLPSLHIRDVDLLGLVTASLPDGFFFVAINVGQPTDGVICKRAEKYPFHECQGVVGIRS